MGLRLLTRYGLTTGEAAAPPTGEELAINELNAAHSWWTMPLAVVTNGQTLKGFVDDRGNIGVLSVDNSTGATSRFTLATHEVDEHSAPALAVLSDGKILAAYSRHNEDSTIRYRVTTSAGDISTWEAEQTLASSAGVSTYAQLRVAGGQVNLFYRANGDTWSFRRSTDDASTWSNDRAWLDASGDLYYVFTQYDANDSNRLHIFMYGHPIQADDHTVRYGYMEMDSGDVFTPSSGTALVNLYSGSATVAPSAFDAVYTPAGGELVRFFDVSRDARILFSTFAEEDSEDSTYKLATLSGGSWSIETITTSGMHIGQETYFPGGVIESATTLILARESSGTWTLERWEDSGGWSNSETLYSTTTEKVYRPIIPENPDNAVPLLFLRGFYGSFTQWETTLGTVAGANETPSFLYDEDFSGGTLGQAPDNLPVLSKSGTTGGDPLIASNATLGVKVARISFTAANAALYYRPAGLTVEDGDIIIDAYNLGDPNFINPLGRVEDVDNWVRCRMINASSLYRHDERIGGTVTTKNSTTLPTLSNSVRYRLLKRLDGQSVTDKVIDLDQLSVLRAVTSTLSDTPAAFGVGFNLSGFSMTNLDILRIRVIDRGGNGAYTPP